MFGLSFGAKHESTKGKTSIDKTVNTNQTEAGSKATTGTTTQTGTSATQQQGTSNTQTAQTGQTTNTSVGSQTNQQQSTLFSQGILSGLEGIIGDLFGTQARAPMSLASNFDKSEFVEQGYRAAENRATEDTNTALNSIYDRLGGRDDSNSMATLLANRARTDTAAQLAGVRSNLTGAAEEIARQNFSADLAGQAQSQGFLNNLLSALKGGTAATTGAIQTAEAQAGTSAQQGTSSTQTANTENQQTSQTTVQDLLELLNNTLSGTERTKGTEKTSAKGTSFGGGFSLGF